MNSFLRVKNLAILLLTISIFLLNQNNIFAVGSIIPTNTNQKDFLKAYKLILYKSYADYRFTSTKIDSSLFPKFGEFSVYWINSGANKGSFVLPEVVPSNYSSVTNTEYQSYNWKNDNHYSIQFKHSTKRVAIFKSKIKYNNNTVSWGAIYFKNMFDSYLYDNMYYFVDEDYLDSTDISSSTELLIIPSFTVHGEDQKYYMDASYNLCTKMKTRIDNFLKRGGMIYAEGNAAYLIEKLSYLDDGAVDFDKYEEADPETNLIDIDFNTSNNPISFTEGAVGNKLYTTSIPSVSLSNRQVIASTSLRHYPACFLMQGLDANGGKIVCNLGLPTIGGLKELKKGSRQLQWTLNTILFTWAKNIDLTRSIWNQLPDSLTAGKNAVSYDRVDTFEVRILVRNLSDHPIAGVQIVENIRPYFSFVDVKTPGIVSDISGHRLTISGVVLPPNSESLIVYRLRTPDTDDKIHENVDKYISWQNYIYGSYNVTSYLDLGVNNTFIKYRNYVNIMFSAKLVADTDLNWKNFLGLYYQPFKVFMIMENKERTPAVGTKYVQYIPKDVPFYWSDKSINIPILKTPGGKYIDVLKGSDDQNNPEFDMDHDGHPDVWLDTASIYPKGYTIVEDSVYWLNPWEHLRTGDKYYYEDIDHDGKRAIDNDGDGIVDVEEPGDKIRVWKVTWDVGKIAGYDYFDPYCSYEIWVDPPPLVPLSAGVGEAYGKLDSPVKDMYYPYTKDLSNADLSDTTWSHWMERDKNGNVKWKQLIYQRIDNYEGFTFIDTAATGYKLKPTDRCVGTVPQPHREFIAVLSLGGEEIDMEHYTPAMSQYSNLKYKTIFGEDRVTPIRTTYTYWAPLPNPLQFEYLTNNFTITNDGGDTLKYLPEWGKANLTFDVDASTEYSYYWIRNAGHDVDYNDPSEKMEGKEELGDGVFGYMVYDIPKGIGGYKITLPTKADGTYDTDAIVQVDGHNWEKWLDNPNTKNAIEVWEDPYQYHIYIPQLLIPPALDDDNFDGIDDWIDDRGDRFASSTGFLHDGFMLDNGEQWRDYPEVPFKDDIYGMVDSGWYHGPDGTYGDDFFENLGKTHFKINCIYNGEGREGPIDISKGGWLVVEEIFGGSPWVIFSHALSGYAQGVDYKLIARSNPSLVKYGLDTSFIKYTVYDENEPHDFNIDFDPYHVSYGYGETTITSYAGGKDPCSLISPSFNMSTIVDPDFNFRKNVTLIPNADPTNPELKDYPKTVDGCFIEVKIEVSNGTDDNWINTTITPILSSALGKTKLVMSYVAYPRPLVPAKVDPITGEIIQGGDDIGAFKAGWRFNQPEGEVLIKVGSKLPLMQPSRRAYFVFLFSVDRNLANDVYDINFKISGQRRHYDESSMGKGKDRWQTSAINYEVPPVKFSISKRDNSGNVAEYQKLIVGNGNLNNINVHTTQFFKGLGDVKWSENDINNIDFDSLEYSIPSNYDISKGIETIDLSQFENFPSPKLSKFYMLEKGEVYSYMADDDIVLSDSAVMNFNSPTFGDYSVQSDKPVTVTTIGPKLMNYKKITNINGRDTKKNEVLTFKPGEKKDVESMVQITNYGNDIAESTVIEMNIGSYFKPIIDKLPGNCAIAGNKIVASMGACVPGQKKQVFLHFTDKEGTCDCMFDTSDVIQSMLVTYKGTTGETNTEPTIYKVPDLQTLDLPAKDLNMYELTANKSYLNYGSLVSITSKIQNGVVPTENSKIKIYAVSNKGDSTLLGEEDFVNLQPYEKTQFTVNYKVEDTLEFVEFYAAVESNQEHTEFCEQNNKKKLEIPFEGPNWIVGVTNYPNPIDYQTNFSYYLPRELKNLTLHIYAFDGQEVDKIDNCPISLGRNTVYWYCANIPGGTYIITFEGINDKGELVVYHGRIVKD